MFEYIQAIERQSSGRNLFISKYFGTAQADFDLTHLHVHLIRFSRIPGGDISLLKRMALYKKQPGDRGIFKVKIDMKLGQLPRLFCWN